MKIAPDHYVVIRDAISALPNEAVAAHKLSLRDDARVNDLGKRFRWDLLHAARLTPWVCSTLYPYMNDSHLDTALRAVVSELGL